jgi:acetyltransferase-like isoleucine patch superfamily enzyme
MRLKNVENIFIGDSVLIHKHAFLLTLRIPDNPAPRLVISDGCTIGHFNHITCVNELVIGRKVLTADRVHISDNSHAFADPNVPIMEQGVVTKGKVSIGDGTWIGEGSSVLSCSIGKNCVIGSNAVVVSDIPDHCVAAGVPARIIRRFNPTSRVWEKTGVKL